MQSKIKRSALIFSSKINPEKEKLLVSLAGISFLSLAEKINLFKKLDSTKELAILSIEEISCFCNREIKRAVWNGMERLAATEKEVALLKAKGIKGVTYSDALYPALLRETSNAPFVLFYYGDISILGERTVSVVGTRHITPEGREGAVAFAKDACLDGVTVVSGLAAGVDAAAHTGSVQAFYYAQEKGIDVGVVGKTCAVLPCGCDAVVPSTNRKLAESIIKTGGCIISEYVPGVPSEKWRFVQRNRIIAALSPSTVVVQAPDGSGALITAQFALEYNRDVAFHKSCFCKNADVVGKYLHSKLETQLALGQISKSKIENTCAKYIECGAPVIEDYKDFCRFRMEKPGERHCKIKENGQLELSI